MPGSGRFRSPMTVVAAIGLVAGGALTGPGSAAAAIAAPTAVPGVFATVPLGFGSESEAIDPTNHLLYTISPDDDVVSVVDGAGDATQGTIVGTITVPPAEQVAFDPSDLVAVDPSRQRLYVFSSYGAVVVIGLVGHGGHILGAIEVNRFSTGIAVDPSSHNLYVMNPGHLVVIDESGDVNEGKVTATIGVGEYPTGLAVDATTHAVYTANYFGSSVSVIDPARRTVANIPVGFTPTSLAVDPALHKVYVTDSHRFVTVIDESTRTVIATIAAGSEASAIAVDSSTHDVYIANWFDNTVSVIDGAAPEEKVIMIAVGAGPGAIAIDPSSDNVYVANEWDGTVSVIGPPADVTLSVSGPATAADGSQFSISVSVADHGPTAAARTSTNLLVPTGLTVVSAPGASLHSGTLIWPVQSLTAGASVSYHVTFSVAAGVHLAAYLGGVALCSGEYDPAPANNTALLPIRLG